MIKIFVPSSASTYFWRALYYPECTRFLKGLFHLNIRGWEVGKIFFVCLPPLSPTIFGAPLPWNFNFRAATSPQNLIFGNRPQNLISKLPLRYIPTSCRAPPAGNFPPQREVEISFRSAPPTCNFNFLADFPFPYFLNGIALSPDMLFFFQE